MKFRFVRSPKEYVDNLIMYFVDTHTSVRSLLRKGPSDFDSITAWIVFQILTTITLTALLIPLFILSVLGVLFVYAEETPVLQYTLNERHFVLRSSLLVTYPDKTIFKYGLVEFSVDNNTAIDANSYSTGIIEVKPTGETETVLTFMRNREEHETENSFIYLTIRGDGSVEFHDDNSSKTVPCRSNRKTKANVQKEMNFRELHEFEEEKLFATLTFKLEDISL